LTHHLNLSNSELLIRRILSVKDEDITCDDCYVAIDQYVDMLRAGKDAAVVLPHVKEHLGQCMCCQAEFKALIAILEAAANPTNQ
jgi:hypothetical protein